MTATRAGQRRRIAWIVLTVARSLTPFTSGAAEPQPRYAKNITLPPLKTEELVAVTLDSDVFAATRDGFPDLRIQDADSRETAFLVRPATEKQSTKVRKTWSPKRPKVKLVENDRLEVTFQLADDDPIPQGMRLVTPLANFEQRVEVFSSIDDNNWKAINDKGLIFDYSQFIDVRNDAIEFSKSGQEGGDARPRRYRIVIDDVTKEQESQLLELTRRLRGDDESDRSERIVIQRQPFRIDRIELWSEQKHDRVAGTKSKTYKVKASPAFDEAEKKQTIVNIATHREPLTSLLLVTSDRNFSRPVQVQAERKRGKDMTWETLASATLSRLDFRDLNRESLNVAFPECREAQLRLVIENRDSPPLAVSDVEAHGAEYQVVFLAKPTETYRLAYGSAALAPASYDTAAITASLAADYTPVIAKLGKQVVTSKEEPTPREPLLARLLNSPVFLTSAVAVFAIALGVGLYRASRRLNDMPE